MNEMEQCFNDFRLIFEKKQTYVALLGIFLEAKLCPIKTLKYIRSPDTA